MHHTPSTLLYTADTLSRVPTNPEGGLHELQQEVESFAEEVVSSLPTSQQRLDAFRNAQAEDLICSNIMQYCHSGWPEKPSVQSSI